METKLRSSLARVDVLTDFISRPAAATIFALIVLAIVLHIWSLLRARKTST